jgi:hypothetical protein
VTYPIVAPAPGLDLAVVDNGVRMPPYEAAPAPQPVREVVAAPQRAVPPPPPPVPVYPAKQDRN